MSEDDQRALYQVRMAQVLESKLKSWGAFIVMMSVWFTVLAVFWKVVLL